MNKYLLKLFCGFMLAGDILFFITLNIYFQCRCRIAAVSWNKKKTTLCSRTSATSNAQNRKSHKALKLYLTKTNKNIVLEFLRLQNNTTIYFPYTKYAD